MSLGLWCRTDAPPGLAAKVWRCPRGQSVLHTVSRVEQCLCLHRGEAAGGRPSSGSGFPTPEHRPVAAAVGRWREWGCAMEPPVRLQREPHHGSAAARCRPSAAELRRFTRYRSAPSPHTERQALSQGIRAMMSSPVARKRRNARCNSTAPLRTTTGGAANQPGRGPARWPYEARRSRAGCQKESGPEPCRRVQPRTSRSSSARRRPRPPVAGRARCAQVR